jgi:dihydrofolate reductase
MTKVSLIVAMDRNRGIGRDNDLMWHLPNDMRFFKETTENQIVVMGRKNYDSIPEKYRPLPNRENVILTKNTSFEASNCSVFHSLDAALSAYQSDKNRKFFIIGGGQIYKLALEAKILEEMFITHIDGNYDADTFFPDFNESDWNKELLMSQAIDERHRHGFKVFRYTPAK